jgi:hypothetical protein
MLAQKDPDVGAIVARPTDFGKDHLGTRLANGLVAHTLPGRGKHISTLREFGAGKPVRTIYLNRTPIENLMAAQRAVMDVGRPYDLLRNNCETDVNRIHFGSPTSPTVKRWTGIG